MSGECLSRHPLKDTKEDRQLQMVIHLFRIKETLSEIKVLITKINTPIQSNQPQTSTNSEILKWVQNLQVLSDEMDSKLDPQKKEICKAFFIVDPSPSDTTRQFIVAFEEQMLKANVKLTTMDTTDEIEKTSTTDRVLVICSITSRTECNLGMINNIDRKCHPRIILILLHCHKSGNSPNSSDINKAKKDYPRIKEVIEMAFDGSIYSCPMNKKALRTIEAIRK